MKINVRKLESIRKRDNKSKASFSRLFGLTDSSYSKLLKSKSTKLATLSVISSTLKIGIDELLLK